MTTTTTEPISTRDRERLIRAAIEGILRFQFFFSVSDLLHSQERVIFALFQIPRRSSPPYPRWPDNQGSECRERILWYVFALES
jgi:hypothetical protein